MDNITLIVLTNTNEMVIGSCMSEDSDNISLKDARFISLSQGPQGQVLLNFIPYPFPLKDMFLITSTNVEIEKINKKEVKRIYIESELKKELITSYLNNISKLVMANAGEIPKLTRIK